MKKIICLHTADVHRATFDRLLKQGGGAEVDHVVRPEWLDRARRDGLTAELKHDVGAFLSSSAATADAILCTCSTLGPIADDTHNQHRNVVRIDRPLMAQAASHSGTILVAICLESTREATLALLQDALLRSNSVAQVEVVHCKEAWPSFERGDMAAFAQSIATDVRSAATRIGRVACIVLGQASMAVAEPLLQDVGTPVYASPRLAAEATLHIARRSR